ncbi:MAG: bifunctional 4-hydroxy-2-oxoglutarate aldolase/2-dehydro-3-deoxy-phosphogluconate aldolase [Nonlabens sp.]
MDYSSFIAQTDHHKIIPVFYHRDPEVAIAVVKASYDGGVRIFEFVNRGANGLDVFKSVVDAFKDHKDLVLGVGTIFDSQTASSFIEAGAAFVVSPGLVGELANFCTENNVAYIPGVGTITEAMRAKHLGCRMIKIFPANVIGSAFAKAVKSVMPELTIMPTGGIEPTVDSMKQWFDAGVSCVGMGSQLFDKKKIAQNDFQALQADIFDAVSKARQLA